MSSISLPIAPLQVNGDALAAMEGAMLALDYCGRARCDAKTIVRHTGCVADCVPSCIDLEHLAIVEEAYVNALPTLPFDDAAWWDNRSVFCTIDDLDDAATGLYRRRFGSIFPPEVVDDPEFDLACAVSA